MVGCLVFWYGVDDAKACTVQFTFSSNWALVGKFPETELAFTTDDSLLHASKRYWGLFWGVFLCLVGEPTDASISRADNRFTEVDGIVIVHVEVLIRGIKSNGSVVTLSVDRFAVD